MKKNFVRVMLFGALTLATVTYVGCKDYDDDIDNQIGRASCRERV